MNNLNSVLLEGVVVRKPRKVTTKTGQTYHHFGIDTVNILSRNNSGFASVEHNEFIIEVADSIEKQVQTQLQTGQLIRVVGLLKNRAGTVKIRAEHLEIRSGSASAA